MERFGALALGVVGPSLARWYTGTVTRLNTDGSYQIWVHELNVVYPRIYRTGPDRRRLLPGERVSLRHQNLVMEAI